MKNIEIIPAILPQDFNEIVEKLERIKGLAKTVQIDICDGHFVPSFTWPYKKHDDNFDRIVHEDEGMPFWENFDFEFDLMINNPEKVVEDWILAGASRIIIHAEAKGDIKKTVEMLRGRAEVGIALNIDTPINTIDLFSDSIQFVQLMGIDKIGFQGQTFDTKVIDNIKSVKSKYPNLSISIDGGVSIDTSHLLKQAGADRLVAGSAIFHSDNPGEVIHKLKQA
jgi:ribulose-phosphate 3-epimerase